MKKTNYIVIRELQATEILEREGDRIDWEEIIGYSNTLEGAEEISKQHKYSHIYKEIQ